MHCLLIISFFTIVLTVNATRPVTWKQCYHKYVDVDNNIESDNSYSSINLPQLCAYVLQRSNATNVYMQAEKLDTTELNFGLIVFNGPTCHADQWNYIKEEGASTIGKNPISFITSEVNFLVAENLFEVRYTKEVYQPIFSNLYKKKDCGGTLTIEADKSAIFPSKFANNQPCIWKIESQGDYPWFQMNQISISSGTNQIWVLDGPDCSSPILQLYTEKSTPESFSRIVGYKKALTIVSLSNEAGPRFTAFYGAGQSKPPSVDPKPTQVYPKPTPVQPTPTPARTQQTTVHTNPPPVIPHPPPSAPIISWKNCYHTYRDEQGLINGVSSYSHPSYPQLCSYVLELTEASNIYLRVPKLQAADVKFGLIVFNGPTCHADQWAYIHTEGFAINGKNPMSFVTSEMNSHLMDPFFQFEYEKEFSTPSYPTMYQTKDCGGTLTAEADVKANFPTKFAVNQPCIWKIETLEGKPWFQMKEISINSDTNLIWILDGPDCWSPVLKLYTEKSAGQTFSTLIGSGKVITVMSLCKEGGTRFTAHYGSALHNPPPVVPIPPPVVEITTPVKSTTKAPAPPVSWKTCNHKYVDEEGIIEGDATYSHPSFPQLCSYELELTKAQNIYLRVPMLTPTDVKFGLIVFNGPDCHSDQWAYINTEGAAIDGKSPMSFVTSEMNPHLAEPFFTFEFEPELSTPTFSSMYKTKECGGTLAVKSANAVDFPAGFALNEPCIWKIQTRIGKPWFQLNSVSVASENNLIWVLDGPKCSSPVLKLYTEKSAGESFARVTGSGKVITIMSLSKEGGTRFTATYGGV